MDSTLITQIAQQVAQQHPGGVAHLNDLLVIIGWAAIFLLWHYRWKLLGLFGKQKKEVCDPINGSRCPEIRAVGPVLTGIQTNLVEIKTEVTEWRRAAADERDSTRKDIDKLFNTTDEHGGKLERLDERTKHRR